MHVREIHLKGQEIFQNPPDFSKLGVKYGPPQYQHYLYTLTRAYMLGLGRDIGVIETGMAHGKSTHALVCALEPRLPNYKLPDRNQLLTVECGFNHIEAKLRLNRWGHKCSPLKINNVTVAYEVGRLWWEFVNCTSQELLQPKFFGFDFDIFLHDSDHSYENQIFEYKWAWEHLPPGGLLVSDDIYWENGKAWFEFLDLTGRNYYTIGNAGVIVK